MLQQKLDRSISESIELFLYSLLFLLFKYRTVDELGDVLLEERDYHSVLSIIITKIYITFVKIVMSRRILFHYEK